MEEDIKARENRHSLSPPPHRMCHIMKQKKKKSIHKFRRV